MAGISPPATLLSWSVQPLALPPILHKWLAVSGGQGGGGSRAPPPYVPPAPTVLAWVWRSQVHVVGWASASSLPTPLLPLTPGFLWGWGVGWAEKQRWPAGLAVCGGRSPCCEGPAELCWLRAEPVPTRVDPCHPAATNSWHRPHPYLLPVAGSESPLSPAKTSALPCKRGLVGTCKAAWDIGRWRPNLSCHRIWYRS